MDEMTRWSRRRLRDEAYRIYQLRWLETNGCSVRDLADDILSHAAAAGTDLRSSDGRKKTFASWEAGPGVAGHIWKSKAEFLETEYLDKDYMYTLLPAVPYASYIEYWKAGDLA